MMFKKNMDDKESFHKYSTRHFFKENTVVYKEGNYGAHFYYIHEGLIKIFTSTIKGNERILNIGYPGQFLGIQAINQNKYLTTAIAIKDSVLYRFQFNEVTELISNHPEFLRLITDTIRHNTSVLIQSLYLDTMTARQRLAFLIMLYVNDFENDKISLTIRDFTNYTGLTRVTVYQILKEWEGNKIITIKGRNFYILKLEYIESYLKQDR